MTCGDTSCNQDLIDHAKLLYGSDWRDRLAEELNLDRRALVLMLASDEPIPPNLLILALESMQRQLDRLVDSHARLKACVSTADAAVVAKDLSDTRLQVARPKAC